MENIVGLLLSVIYIVLIMGVSIYFYKNKKITLQESRKFIHIGLSNWWLIAWLFFDNVLVACLLPLLFIIINFVNYKKNIISGIEENDQNRRTFGTVWYAVSLFILSLVLFSNNHLLYLGALGILILGYGDGLASIMGIYFGKKTFEFNKRTIVGSLTMFIVSFILTYIILSPYVIMDKLLIYSFFIATTAMMVEVLSPFSLDNLLVPLIVALQGYYLVIGNKIAYDMSMAFSVTAIIIFIVLIKRKLTYFAGLFSLMFGFLIYYLGGPVLFGALIAFFLTSIIVEHYHNKPLIQRQKNLNQVIENGFAALLFSVMYYYTSNEAALIAAFVAIAGATADTWSSGIGYYSKESVRSIFTWRIVPKGESGGVTRLGSFAALAGALLIALISLLMPSSNLLLRTLIIFVFGAFTSVLDSVFGVFAQAKYYDKKKDLILETKPSKMNSNIEKISGYNIVTNGMVNFITIMISSILSLIVASIFF